MTQGITTRKGANPPDQVRSKKKHQKSPSPLSVNNRVPADKPPFTIADLRNAIPEHCWKRSTFTSMLYLVGNLAICALLFFTTKYIETGVTNDGMFGRFAPLIRSFLWSAYWIVQGAFMTGLWVIGHECGHGAFSESELVNDAVGFPLHTALLVPYFSWKYTHGRHHSNTGNLARDEVFVPLVEQEVEPDNPLLWSLPGIILQIIITFTVGWPGYITFNITSHKHEDYDGFFPPNHFSPFSPLFTKRERKFIILSDLGLIIAGVALWKLSAAYTFSWVLKVYLVPYFIVNFWLVLITLLQHTDTALPHYQDSEWDWLRGALATIDRDYGIMNHIIHHIGDTHVCHHIFSKIPHYHAQEATEALKPILKDYYRMDRTPIAQATWRVYNTCHYVKEEVPGSGVMWFQHISQHPKKKH